MSQNVKKMNHIYLLRMKLVSERHCSLQRYYRTFVVRIFKKDYYIQEQLHISSKITEKNIFHYISTKIDPRIIFRLEVSSLVQKFGTDYNAED